VRRNECTVDEGIIVLKMIDRVYLDLECDHGRFVRKPGGAIADALDLPGNASSIHAEGREARQMGRAPARAAGGCGR